MRLNRPKHSGLNDGQRLKANARAIAKYYVKIGRIERKACEVCGAFDSQIHHEDYAKPLDVKWLCRRHHLIEHGHNPK